jgi:hypothetical protein
MFSLIARGLTLPRDCLGRRGVIIEAAAALVRQERHAAIVVVDDNGNVAQWTMNGTSSFFQRFAAGSSGCRGASGLHRRDL